MRKNGLKHELAELLNKHSAETASDTPDFVLAQFLLSCLNAYNAALRQRAILANETLEMNKVVGTSMERRSE